MNTVLKDLYEIKVKNTLIEHLKHTVVGLFIPRIFGLYTIFDSFVMLLKGRNGIEEGYPIVSSCWDNFVFIRRKKATGKIWEKTIADIYSEQTQKQTFWQRVKQKESKGFRRLQSSAITEQFSTINLISINKKFLTNNHVLATHEHTKKGLS